MPVHPIILGVKPINVNKRHCCLFIYEKKHIITKNIIKSLVFSKSENKHQKYIKMINKKSNKNN